MSERIIKNKASYSNRTHYYIPEAMPLVLCGVFLIIAMEYSKKVKDIYDQIVDSYVLPCIKGYLDPSVLTIE